MAVIRKFKTIPELFVMLTEEYAKTTDKPVMKYKVAGQYKGISYGELKDQTEDFANGLLSLGFKREDKIAIISENRPEWIYSDMGILALGGIDVPIYPSLTADSVEFILNNSEAVGIIVSNKFQLNKTLKIRANCKALKYIIVLNEKDVPSGVPEIFSFREIQERGIIYRQQNPFTFRESIKACRPDDMCTMIYTSGTTGVPKGVMLTHWNIVSNVFAASEAFPFNDQDVFLSFLPLCHIFERMAGYYTAFSSGCTVCYAEGIEAVANNMIEVKPTIITTVPRLFERIYGKIRKNVESQSEKKQKIFNWALETGREYAQAKKADKMTLSLALKHKAAEKLVLNTIKEKTGGRLRFFVSGGAALPRELGEFFEAVGITILEGYGLTEASPVIAANRVDDYKFGSVGKPFPGVEVKIAPDGEILARGPNIMHGYYKNRKETEMVLKDGWLHTGDIGVFDAEGFLVITDRKKHLFKTSGGKYIAPTPIENLFLGSKYIDQFVLIGDRRMFLSALIVPDFEAIREYADSHGIDYQSNDDLTNSREIYDLIEKDLEKFQKQLANYERVRKFVLLDRPFSLESGEVTPTLKLKRKVIEERYGNLIEEMYSSLEK
ncbi:MAG: long-chain fatty acid--CoA ligase [Ignavibacteria bacterium]|jgi:long-chain acyl-CoA synthetase|nr:long-chain fatty acid--CoA ligase [Ignavibacteria bacterium]MCU7502418.1 long-chain fatty acid--CoA ligase [Ignavibacteria bacterium]MCU7515017.1 long-chain fatty acid--CoA ligase [Ignavibacteria bacterium]